MCDCKKVDYRHLSHHKAGYNFHWSFSNTKLAKEGIVSFNLPAFKSESGFTVCPNASTCALVCYARQGRYLMSLVSEPREHNLAWLRSHDTGTFITPATEDIHNLHPAWSRIRIHDSGDFFSEPYMLAWFAIARNCPHMEFYAYTKMITLLTIHRADIPKNLHMIQSVGGKEDQFIDATLPHAFIFPTQEALEHAGYVDGTKSDRPAYSKICKIGLVYHGTTKLTAHKAELLTRRLMLIHD